MWFHFFTTHALTAVKAVFAMVVIVLQHTFHNVVHRFFAVWRYVIHGNYWNRGGLTGHNNLTRTAYQG